MSWRRRTCRDDGSCRRTGVAGAGKAAEQLAELSKFAPCRKWYEKVIGQKTDPDVSLYITTTTD